MDHRHQFEGASDVVDEGFQSLLLVGFGWCVFHFHLGDMEPRDRQSWEGN